MAVASGSSPFEASLITRRHASGDTGNDQPRQAPVVIAGRAQHHQRHGGTGRHAQHPGRGRRQHEPTHPRSASGTRVLREQAAERIAENVDTGIAEGR